MGMSTETATARLLRMTGVELGYLTPVEAAGLHKLVCNAYIRSNHEEINDRLETLVWGSDPECRQHIYESIKASLAAERERHEQTGTATPPPTAHEEKGPASIPGQSTGDG